MRLLQVSLRTLLLYSLIVVLISIPVSIFTIREILSEEVDESLALHSDQFVKHINRYEYLEDLDLDLKIWDQLSYDVILEPAAGVMPVRRYQTIVMYDSLAKESNPFRTLTSSVVIKNKPYVLTVRLSLVDNNELLVALGAVQVILIIILVTGLLLLNRSLSKRLWRPFYNTLNQLRAYELNKSELITPQETGIVEFDDLNKTVSNLTERNRKVFLEQKEFIENASHELQTPLSVFQSKLDTLMQIPGLNEAGAVTIFELEETVRRMSKLNKNLLLLSKIDNDQFTEQVNVDVAMLATTFIANLQSMPDLGNIAVKTKIDSLTIKANDTLIEVLLLNLFHNAIRHCDVNGKVSIEISNGTLTVANTGKPVKMDATKMFSRFSKESTDENSLGLGLAIVKRICDVCSYKLNYAFLDGLHTFTVTF